MGFQEGVWSALAPPPSPSVVPVSATPQFSSYSFEGWHALGSAVHSLGIPPIPLCTTAALCMYTAIWRVILSRIRGLARSLIGFDGTPLLRKSSCDKHASKATCTPRDPFFLVRELGRAVKAIPRLVLHVRCICQSIH